MWKLIYGLKIVKEGQEDPFEGRKNEEEEENEKEEEEEKEKEEEIVEMTHGEEATTEEQQEEQSVQDTQLPPPSPPHKTPIDIVIVKYVPNTLGQNINPLTTEDLKRILHQSTLQAQLCTNLVLVSVDELQKAIVEITREKENTQELPTQPPTTTIDQTKEKEEQDKISKVDNIVTITTTIEEQTKEQIGQDVPTAQSQGAPPQILIIDQGSREEERTPKEKEQEAIQMLENLPTLGIPNKKLSIDAIPFQIVALGLSSTKVARVLHYGDPTLDKEIVIPNYKLRTMNLQQINEVQEALERRKRQEILRNEYRQKQALV